MKTAAIILVSALVLIGTLLWGTATLMLLGRDGCSLLDLMFVACASFSILLAFLSMVWLPMLIMRGQHRSRIACLDTLPDSVPSVGIIVPVYEEDMAAVCRRLLATWCSLMRDEPRLTSNLRFCVLSDSGPELELKERGIVEEIAAVNRLPIVYRRRTDRRNAKPGNVYAFMTSEEARGLDYLVGYDADSYMSGQSISRLVRIMLHPENRDVALVQAPTMIHAPQTVLGLIDAWSSKHMGAPAIVYFQRLLGGWNYYGHNYVARPGPFRDAVGHVLSRPVVSRFKGLCGYIASHDLAEGVVLGEKGYRVLFDDVPSESYEESPGSFQEYIRRDQRWLRGSIQHLITGWSCRGPLPQAYALTYSAVQYINSIIHAISMLLALVLIIRREAFLGMTSWSWNTDRECLDWAYTPLPLILFLGMTFTFLAPAASGVLWNTLHQQRSISWWGVFQAFLKQLPEYVIINIVALLFGPVLAVSRFLGAWKLLLQPLHWKSRGGDCEHNNFRETVFHLTPIWGIGFIVMLLALGQPAGTTTLLSIAGMPLICSPLTAMLLSSTRMCQVLRSTGLFYDVDHDHCASILSAAGDCNSEGQEQRAIQCRSSILSIDA